MGLEGEEAAEEGVYASGLPPRFFRKREMRVGRMFFGILAPTWLAIRTSFCGMEGVSVWTESRSMAKLFFLGRTLPDVTLAPNLRTGYELAAWLVGSQVYPFYFGTGISRNRVSIRRICV